MATDRVFLLDENTANRIAAGEVVERPASAVKELVENAIDAGATRITVSLEEGGKRLIRVTDDGCGMTRSDAILSLQRHATSKIQSADDLFSIHTLGFRGEALPSIASVSHFSLATKPSSDESGTMLQVDGGDIVSVSDIALRDGTTVEVLDLFYNTPARLKFLKSTAAETSRAIETVGVLAIAYSDVALRVLHGQQESFSSPGKGGTLAALASVWGRETARRLIPVQHDTPGLSVTGYIATPDITRPGRTHELFFVNRRPVKSRLLGHALEDAFRSISPDGRFPIAAIFVDVSPNMVDVNVHPTKTEVKFTRDGEVHHAVSQAIKRALLDYGIVPMAKAEPLITLPEASLGPDTQAIPGLMHSASAFRRSDAFTLSDVDHEGNFTRPHVSFSVTSPLLSSVEAYVQSGQLTGELEQTLLPGELTEPTDDNIQEPVRPRPFAERLREFSVLGQALNTYIIALTPDGIAVIDQHVAHERVLYERLTVKRFALGIPVQRLVVPLTIGLSRREALLLAEHCDSFAASGWDITPFGGESFVVRAVPAVLAHKPYEKILRDMIEELVNQSISRRLLVQRDHVTITNACKMAVKAGDPLTIPEMSALLEQLAETENPYLCPHGRPIVVTVSYNEIEKLFKRA